MKQRILYKIMMVGMLAISCESEIDEFPLTSGANVVLSIKPSNVKSALDPSTLEIAWQEGDQVMIWSRGTPKNTILTAQSSGVEGKFIGEKGELDIDKDLYAVYPASSVKMLSSGYSAYQVFNYSEQTGLLSDFGKYNVSFSEALTKEIDGDKVTLSNSSKLTNLFAVLKFTIKDGIDVRAIKIEGFDDDNKPTNISGSLEEGSERRSRC